MKMGKYLGMLVLGLITSLNCEGQSNTKIQSSQPAKPSKAEGKDTSPTEAGLVQVPKNIDHRPFDQLLKKYVDEKGLVDYATWKNSEADLKALRDYTDKFSGREPFATGKEREASLINAYNALTLRWILENYPTESTQELKDSFDGKRHLVGGQTVSLDEMEHQTLRPLVGYRIHSALVCAARSCPPLSRDAYREDILDQQLDEGMRRWLARADLNTFDPQKNKAHVSSLFKWFKADFGGKDEGVLAVLAKYAPVQDQPFLRGPGVKIDYLDYNWGLNDQGGRGKKYHRGWWKRIFG